jgi:hypothetical protein
MGYNSDGRYVTKPVSINDVQRALGSAQNDLGTLCTNTNINKWAKYKPVKVAKVGRLTYNELANAKFGLVPAQNILLKTYGDGSDGTVIPNKATLESVLDANADWLYQQPTGGTASPYRLTDFYAPSDNDGGYGYYGDTPQPLSNVSDWVLNLSDIYNCYAATIGYTSGTESWKVNDTIGAPTYSALSFRFDSTSYGNIGGMDVKAIPLNDLLGLMNTNEYWRLVIAVQVPRSGAFQTMRFFTSRWSFLDAHNQSNPAALVLPSISTNQTLCGYINDYATYLKTLNGTDIIGNIKTSTSNPIFRLPACICLVKGAFLDRDGGTKNHCKIGGNSLVYSTPSSMSRFNIIVTDDRNYSGTDAYKVAEIISVSTGRYAQMGEATYQRHEIRNVVLKQKKVVPSGTILYYSATYTYVSGYNGNVPVTITNTVNSSVELSTSADSLVNMVIAGGPGLTLGETRLSLTPF